MRDIFLVGTGHMIKTFSIQFILEEESLKIYIHLSRKSINELAYALTSYVNARGLHKSVSINASLAFLHFCAAMIQSWEKPAHIYSNKTLFFFFFTSYLLCLCSHSLPPHVLRMRSCIKVTQQQQPCKFTFRSGWLTS